MGLRVKPLGERCSVLLATRITPDQYEDVRELAEEKDWTIAQIVRKALEQYVNSSKKRAA